MDSFETESLKTLIKKNEHEKILELPSPEYNRYKVIAAIHLEKYEEALLYASENSFEQAYAYYKLKNFKKSLKILRKLTGKAVDILKSQNLYFLGYYAEAYALLSAHGCSDEIAVNLSAIEALNGVRKPSIFASEHDQKAVQSKKYKFNEAECLMESEYNLTFRFIENEKEYVKMLMDLKDKYNVQGSCIDKQLKNLAGEIQIGLTRRELETDSFNRGTVMNIKNPVLFQRQFIETEKGEYKILRDYQLDKKAYIMGQKSFEPCTKTLKLLKSLIISRRKQTPERRTKVAKTLKGLDSCLESEILKLLSSEIPEEQFQKQALDLIFKASSCEN